MRKWVIILLILLLLVTVAVWSLTDKKDGVKSEVNNTPPVSEVLADLIADKHKTAAIISENIEATQQLREIVVKELGESLIADALFSSSENDFQTMLLGIAEVEPEALVINVESLAAGEMIINQIKKLGLKTELYSDKIFNNAEGLIIVGEDNKIQKIINGETVLVSD
ncbi:MAG: hypothetical protein ABH822_00090 [Patescibacteria group bacterium]